MFEKLKSWLLDSPAAGPDRPYKDHEVACAALLVEAAAMDGHFDPQERDLILGLLQTRFSLSADQAESLLAVAEKRQSGSNEIFKFALATREAFDEAEREQFIEMLWMTVLSDGQLHDYEGSLMRRIAGLLHVPDKAAGEARKRAAKALESRTGAVGEGDEE